MAGSRNGAPRDRGPGILLALGAAFLFGAATPAAKVLLGHVAPTLLAGLLYLGSGLGLSVYLLIRDRSATASREAGLQPKDLPWLSGAIAAGGIAGPVLLMIGLESTPASTTSLLLNLEAVFTGLLALFLFGEDAGTRVLVGIGTITAGCAVLGSADGGSLSFSWGAVAVAGACLAWGLDNNLTRKVSARDPVQVAAWKGWIAGGVNLTAGFAVGADLPPGKSLLAAGAVGVVGYGISLALFVAALRHLGATRASAYFATAPFLGAGISFLFLGEPLTGTFAVGATLVAGGVWLQATERHDHRHAHSRGKHEHRHRHDEHHGHDHPRESVGDVSHSHRHDHGPLLHHHPHYPDIHHRHPH